MEERQKQIAKRKAPPLFLDPRALTQREYGQRGAIRQPRERALNRAFEHALKALDIATSQAARLLYQNGMSLVVNTSDRPRLEIHLTAMVNARIYHHNTPAEYKVFYETISLEGYLNLGFYMHLPRDARRPINQAMADACIAAARALGASGFIMDVGPMPAANLNAIKPTTLNLTAILEEDDALVTGVVGNVLRLLRGNGRRITHFQDYRTYLVPFFVDSSTPSLEELARTLPELAGKRVSRFAFDERLEVDTASNGVKGGGLGVVYTFPVNLWADAVWAPTASDNS